MNFKVSLDEDLARRLAARAKRTGARRNALVRQAVADLVDRTASWPDVVVAWKGDASVTPFESFRAELGDAKDDPPALGGSLSRKRTPRLRAR